MSQRTPTSRLPSVLDASEPSRGRRRRLPIEPLEQRIAPAANNWIGAGSGNWTDDGNWSDGTPTADDDVTINHAGTVTITINSGARAVNTITVIGDDTLALGGGSLTVAHTSSISKLSMSSGTLTGTELITLTGASTLAPGGGALSGTIRNEGTLSITGGIPQILNGTLVNAGTVLQSGGSRLDFGTGGEVENLATGNWSTSQGAHFGNLNGGTSGFENAGTLTNTADGSSLNGIRFDNLPGGKIVVTGGNLQLNGSGHWQGSDFAVSAGAGANFNGTTATFSGTFIGSGPGALTLSSGTITPTAAGATFSFPQGFFQMSSGGRIAGGVLTNSAFLSITAGTPQVAEDGVLRNSGTVLHSGGSRLDFFGDGRVENLAAGIWSTSEGAHFGNANSGASGFENAGTLRNTANGSYLNGILFNNLPGGKIVVTGGSLQLNSRGLWQGGDFTIASGTSANFDGTTATFAGTFTGSGAGALLFSSGTVTPTAAGATFSFPQGFFQMSSGAKIGGGVLTNSAFLSITSGTPQLVEDGVLRNSGTVLQSGGSRLDFFGDGRVENLAGAFWKTSQGAHFGNINGGASGFENAGTLQNTDNGSSLNGILFNNLPGGKIDVLGGSLQLNSGGLWQGAQITVASGANANFNGTTARFAGTFTGAGAGSLTLNSGTLRPTPEGVVFAFPQDFFQLSSGGRIEDGVLTNTGFISITSGTPTIGEDGVLRNAGTVLQRGGSRLDFFGTGGVENLAGAVWQMSEGAHFGNLNAGGSGFANAGTVRVTNSGSSFNGVRFDNLPGGKIDVVGGSLQMNSVGLWKGAEITVAAGATANFNGNAAIFSETFTGSGAGALSLTSGPITPGPGGVIFDFPQNFFSLGSGGVIKGGVLTNTGSMTIGFGIPQVRQDGVWRNEGTVLHTGGSRLDFFDNGRVENAAGALWQMSQGAHFGNLNSGASGFVNAGTLRVVDNGSSLNSVPLTNTGTVEVTGGQFQLNGVLTQFSSGTLTGGTWAARGGTLDFNGRAITSNAATIVVESGFTGLASLASNNGTLILGGGVDLSTVTNFQNTGRVRLGEGSVLTVASYTQSAAGRLEFEVGGPTAADHGRLVSTGVVTLAGVARVDFSSDLTLGAGQTLQLMSFSSRSGDFARFDGLNLQRTTLLERVVSNTALTLNSLVDAANLDVLSVSAPGSGIAGQSFAFSYTVQNVSSFATLATSWTDTVYLSKDGVLSPDDTVFTRVTHSGAVPSAGSYTENVTLPLIGMIPDDYRLLVLADSRGLVPDPDRANNLGASAGTIALDMPQLTPGTPFTGTIAAGQDYWFRVTLPQGATPSFVLSGAVAGEAEIYSSFGEVPTRAEFDESAFALGSSVQRIVGDASAAGTYYLLAHGREAAGAGQSFTLSAAGLGFDLLGAEFTRGANIGKVTTTLTGSQFTPGTSFQLTAGATVIPASAVWFHDAATMSATFDLTGVPIGPYDIVATNGGVTDELDNAFLVFNEANSQGPGKLQYNVSSPRYIRPPFNATTVSIVYQNTGSTDLDAPIFNLLSENARVFLGDGPDVTPATLPVGGGRELGVIELLGVSGGLGGVLSPGESGRIDLVFQPIAVGPHVLVNFEVLVAGVGNAPLDHTVMRAALQPAGVSAEAWNVVFANFQAAVGTTVSSYRAMLVDNANYLSQFGPVSPEVTKLIDFELEQAGQLGVIVDRYELGAFGRGSSPMPFGGRIFVGAAGDVTLKDGSLERVFVKQVNGGYRGTGVDFGVLTRSGAGVFTLDEGDGSKSVFRASDGRIDFVETLDGTRITAAWNANGQLLSLANSVTGDSTSYTYNAQGRVASETDPVGRVTSYGYDAGGEHLLTVTNAAGTATYSYVTGQGAAREHAVATAAGADGVVTSFVYDAQGRVIQRTLGSGPSALTIDFSYDSAGRVTGTDADGKSTSTFYVAQGSIARTIDSQGKFSSASYDAQGRPVSVTDASGVKTRFALDANGLLRTVTEPGRAQTQFVFGGDVRRLQSVVDPNGDAIKLSYDTAGHLTETLFPDETAIRYEYDVKGRLLASTDANGARTAYTYDLGGLVTQRTLPDGSTVSYTYDTHRNLLTATDAEGTTTMTYDAADRLLSIAYPNDKTITITYDAQGRRATVADQLGFTVRYSYDALGRLDVVRDTGGATLVDYDYNALGQLATETRGNGATTAYAYDFEERVTAVIHRDASNAITGFFNYTYDAHDRVKTVTDGGGTTTYTYDLDGQLVGAALPGGRTIAYSYDADGNRVSVTDSAAGTANYSTNNADQTTTAGAETLTYDRAGRVVARTAGGVLTSYSYDASGRLAGITTPGTIVAFDYDALGNRIAKIENGVRTDFAQDPAGLGTLFGEYTGAAATAHYVSGFGVAARTDAAGAASFYHYDGGGNTALLTGAGGASVASYTYLPFGKIASQTGASAQPFTYSGAAGVTDEAGDLFSMRARVYDAGLGRFTSRDPGGVAGGDTNLYRYALNDPINAADPTGLQPSLGGFPSIGSIVSNFGGNYFPVRGFIPRGAIGDVGLVLSGAAGGIPSAANVINPVTHGALAGELSVASQLSRTANSALNAVANPGAHLPAVYDEAFAAQQLLSKSKPVQDLSKGSSLLSKVINLPKPIIKVLAPVAKVLNKIVPPPVQAVLAVKDVYDIEKSAYDYYKDAGTYGKFNPDERQFPPEFYRDHPNSWLLTELTRKGIANGKSKPEATQDALRELRKLNNDYLRNQPQQNDDDGTSDSEIITPNDPNNIVGPSGPGADPFPENIGPGQVRFDGFVNGTNDFAYRIDFENKSNASAPAQIVRVTQTLDADLDLSSFRFTNFGWGHFRVVVPEGTNGTSFHRLVDQQATLGVNVQIDATVDTVTRLLTITYTSLDPNTNEAPADPFAGFLPPNDATGRGDGYANYSVAPLAGLQNGTDFDALATIVFDTENPIDTPSVTNTLDIAAPVSTVTAFTSGTSFRESVVVRWSADDANGSGLLGTTIYVSKDGGPLEAVTIADTSGAVRFTGEVGSTYTFFSTAIDRVGNFEPLAATPDATITIAAPPLVTATNKTAVLTDTDGDIYTIKLTGPGTLKYATLDPDGSGPLHGPLDFLVAESTTLASSLSVTVKRKGDGPDAGTAPDGDGMVTIGDVRILGSLNAFSAKASDLVINGFSATGAVKSISVRDLTRPDALLADPLITLGGTNVDRTVITARNLADGFAITTPGILTSITAADLGDGRISASSLGRLTTTVGAMDANLVIGGAVGPITVKNGVNAGNWSGASFGAITVSSGSFDADVATPGALTSLTVKAGGVTGQVAAKSFGAVSITGGNFSGLLSSTTPAVTLGRTAALTSLTIAGGDLTGDLELLGRAGNVTIRPGLLGVGGDLTGDLTAASFGAITLTGGAFTGSVESTATAATLVRTPAITSISVTGGNLDGGVTALGKIGAITVKANAQAQGGTLGGDLTAAGFGAIKLTGGSLTGDLLSTASPVSLGATAALASLTITGGNLAGDVTALGKVGAITLKANTQGVGGSLSGDLTAASFGRMTLTGGSLSGSVTSLIPAVTLGLTPALAGLAITGGDLTGDIRLLGSLGAVSVLPKTTIGGNITGASIVASKIASVIVGKNITNAIILAGADLGANHLLGGGDDTFGAGTMGAITVGTRTAPGDVTNSILGAGYVADDDIVKDADDTIFGATPAARLANTIASLTVTGQADSASYFIAGKFKASPSIAGVKLIDLTNDARFLIS